MGQILEHNLSTKEMVMRSETPQEEAKRLALKEQQQPEINPFLAIRQAVGRATTVEELRAALVGLLDIFDPDGKDKDVGEIEVSP